MFYRIQIIIFCYTLSTAVDTDSKCSSYSVFSNTFHCENITSLKELELPFTAEIVYIRKSKLSKITANVFHSRFPNLRFLDLSGQEVEEIEPEAFSGLPELNILHLSHNSITKLPPHSSPNVRSVVLAGNKISSIDPEAFANANELSDLRLEGNRLEILSSGLFKGCHKLTSLSLSDNKIQVIEENAFEGAENLEFLSLENNQISDMPPNTFSKLKNLYGINLNNNNLTVIRSGWFSHLTKLRHFSAAHNKIKLIESNSFQNALELTTVFLSHNQLSHIHTLTTNSTKFSDASLSEIDLSNNQFSEISSEGKEFLCHFRQIRLDHNQLSDDDVGSLIRCPNVRFLSMEGNKIKNLKVENFVNSSLIHCVVFSHNEIEDLDHSIFLKSTFAWLDNNKITKLPKNIPGQAKVSNLQLGHNKIQSIEENTFKNFTELQVLQLSYNEISAISPGAFNSFSNLTNHYYLYLSFNKIKSFENWFIEGSSVANVEISHNQIDKININSLKGAVSLQFLDLSYNEISELSPNSIQNFTNLYEIYLLHNNLSVLSENSFANCPRLQLLDLSYNNIETIHPNAFRNLPDLINLHLSNNRLTVLTESIFLGTPYLNYLNVSFNEIESISPHIFPKNRIFNQFMLDASHNRLENITQQLFSKHSPTGMFMFDFTYNKIDKKEIDSFLQHFVKDSKLKVSLHDNFINDNDCAASNGKPGSDVCVIKICEEGKCDYSHLLVLHNSYQRY